MPYTKNKVVFLDAGHGGLDKYGNYVTAPGKQFRHTTEALHSDGWFFEGVWNRHFVNEYLAPEIRKRKIMAIPIFHPSIDTPVHQRVKMYESLMWMCDDFIVASTHANAFRDPSVSGFEVHIHPFAGRGSRSLAALLNKNTHTNCPWVRIRSTKRKTRWTIVSGKGTAVLIENGYMTNLKEALDLFDDSSCINRAKAQANAFEGYFR